MQKKSINKSEAMLTLLDEALKRYGKKTNMKK
jgi:hypothetical protein